MADAEAEKARLDELMEAEEQAEMRALMGAKVEELKAVQEELQHECAVVAERAASCKDAELLPQLEAQSAGMRSEMEAVGKELAAMEEQLQQMDMAARGARVKPAGRS